MVKVPTKCKLAERRGKEQVGSEVISRWPRGWTPVHHCIETGVRTGVRTGAK